MKKNYFLLKNVLSILMIFSALTLNAQTHITDRAGLEAIANDVTGSYILDNDIDLSGTDWGGDFHLNGTLDGNGFKILNLTISAGESVGLFKQLDNDGLVKNLGFVSVNITAGSKAGAVAGLCGSGTISNCFIESGTITTSGELVGGFGGLCYGTTVQNCYSNADVTGAGHVGGILGHMNGGLIEDCHVDAIITSTNIVAGGIVGWPHEADGAIKRCYAKGEVRAAVAFAGGIVGVDDNTFLIEITDCIAAQDSIMVNDSIVLVPNGQRIIPNVGTPNTVLLNNYAIATVAGDEWVDDANGLDGATMTAAQFLDGTFFADNLPNWDFGLFGDGVWQMTNGGPLLAWEIDPYVNIHNLKETLNAEVYSNNGIVYVNTREAANASIKFYSITGSLLQEAKLKSNLETFELNYNGVLIIEIVSSKARGVFKLINKL